MSADARTHLATLLDSPTTRTYTEIATNYDTTNDLYTNLTRHLPAEIDSFDDAITYYQLLITESDVEDTRVQNWINNDLADIITDMVLGDPTASDTPDTAWYAAETLVDVTDRLAAYHDLGVHPPALEYQLDSIIETLYDNDWRDGYRVIHGLLSDIPDDCDDDLVEPLARLHAGLALHTDIAGGDAADTDDQLVIEARRFKAWTAPPLDDDNAPDTAEACHDEAATYSYDVARKWDLCATAVHHDPTYTDAFAEYLYLTARTLVEQYRHSGSNPSRAQLAIASLQFDVLATSLDVDWPAPEATAWIHSYNEVVDAMLMTGALYKSTRAGEHDVDFVMAAEAYRNAAVIVKEAAPERSVKYLSKAFRHEANAATTPYARKSCYERAKQALFALVTDGAYASCHNVIQDALRYHHYLELGELVQERFFAHDYEGVVDAYIKHHELAGTISQVTTPRDTIECTYHIAQARLAVDAGEGDRAVTHLNELAEYDLSKVSYTVADLRAHAFLPVFQRATRHATGVTTALIQALLQSDAFTITTAENAARSAGTTTTDGSLEPDSDAAAGRDAVASDADVPRAGPDTREKPAVEAVEQPSEAAESDTDTVVALGSLTDALLEEVATSTESTVDGKPMAIRGTDTDVAAVSDVTLPEGLDASSAIQTAAELVLADNDDVSVVPDVLAVDDVSGDSGPVSPADTPTVEPEDAVESDAERSAGATGADVEPDVDGGPDSDAEVEAEAEPEAASDDAAVSMESDS